MSTVEREYIRSVDEVILNASGKTLKKLQELDMKTQLHANTFYDAYSIFHEEPKKEKIPSSTKHSRKK
jgi:hypothetical protein